MSNIEVDTIPSPLVATFFALYAMCRCPIGFGDAGQRSNRCSHLSARLRVRANFSAGTRCTCIRLQRFGSEVSIRKPET